jgi:hypothetical protein
VSINNNQVQGDDETDYLEVSDPGKFLLQQDMDNVNERVDDSDHDDYTSYPL